MAPVRQNGLEDSAPYPVHSLRKLYVKYHDADGYLHYDVRFEYRGVLLSWALPKGLSNYPGDSCEAIEVDDHQLKYGDFEGVRLQDTFMLWDSGMWAPAPECVNIDACLRNGVFRFVLYGEKLKGGWTLTRTPRHRKSGRTIWTISKDSDPFARLKDATNVIGAVPRSVRTNRTMDEIKRDGGKKGPRSEPTLF